MQVHWEKTRCIGCGNCVEACTKAVLTSTASGILINRSECDSCGACAQACPSTALELYGELTIPVDLVREVLKDKAYFQKSGGGVTLSGGEPTLQPLFARELLTAFRRAGIHTALDTCGQCSREILEELLPDVDLVLYDVKEIDPVRHREFAGVSNSKILANLMGLARAMKERGSPRELWIRTPLIPGYTDTPANLRGIGMFIREHLGSQVSRWELCAFNNLCLHKYEGLGVNWSLSRAALLSADETDHLARLARESGVDPGIVHLSGPTGERNPVESASVSHQTGGIKNGVC
jgi:pyruvate formate lyase activating enzyme